MELLKERPVILKFTRERTGYIEYYREGMVLESSTHSNAIENLFISNNCVIHVVHKRERDPFEVKLCETLSEITY